MPIKADLDAIDWKILRELQEDGRMTNVELSRRVGISAPPCLRRVKRLEETGIIRGYRALLNAPALGMDVVAFCLIGLHHQSDAELRTFAGRTRGWPIVRDAWNRANLWRSALSLTLFTTGLAALVMRLQSAASPVPFRR